MISDDLAGLSDRMAGHALHGTAPSPTECAAIAAELAKWSQIVQHMEVLPLDVTLSLLTAVPEWVLAQTTDGTTP